MGDTVKEYSIATEALGKRADFDPRLDPIVRIQAGKLRARLARYYETEGAADPIRIDLAKGRYIPLFTRSPELQPRTLPVDAQAAETIVASPPNAETLLPASGARQKYLWAVATAVVVISTIAIWFVSTRNRSHLRPASFSASTAVLPFQNLGNNRDDEYFSDGLTEELISSLARVPGLHLIGRTSAFQFQGKTIDIREIGQKLGVGTVLEGTVRRSGARLRITAQLSDTTLGTVVWSETYDRDVKDALAIQSSIAQAITAALKINLTSNLNSGEKRGSFFAGEQALDPKTHETYLKGRYFWNKNTPQSISTAIDYFQQALQTDPQYAPAWTGLADCYVALPVFTAASTGEVVPKIRSAALKALDLDPSAGQAHIDLAEAAMYEFRWTEAEKEFVKGLALNPGDAVAHHWYGNFLLLTGRVNEAVQQDQVALSLDPISPYMAQSVGRSLRFARRDDESIEQLRMALTLDPNYPMAKESLGFSYLQKGMHSEAINELDAASTLMGNSPSLKAELAYAYAVAGNASKAKQMLEESVALADRGLLPANSVALIYFGLGDKGRAFEWLHKAVENRAVNLMLKSDPIYQPLRADPKFVTLLEQMNLTP